TSVPLASVTNATVPTMKNGRYRFIEKPNATRIVARIRSRNFRYNNIFVLADELPPPLRDESRALITNLSEYRYRYVCPRGQCELPKKSTNVWEKRPPANCEIRQQEPDRGSRHGMYLVSCYCCHRRRTG